MKNSLSVILPVRNAQQTLAARVGQLLELLPELTSWFEIVIVDDASTDHTDDVAHELMRDYPQVRYTRLRQSRGMETAIQMGIDASIGEVVFVQDEQAPLNGRDFDRLWELRHDQELVLARPLPPAPKSLSKGLIGRLMRWGTGLDKRQPAAPVSSTGLQMLRRSALHELENV